MAITLEQVTAHALTLTPAERVELADRLWASVDDDDLPLSPEWQAEIERRIKEIDDGVAVTIPAEEVFAKLRAELEQRRSHS